ncbi:nucleotidyl transferase AbiEii/AbiGii toxin family protein [Rhizobium lusitanum]|uniref:Putative nucleotidyltransferase component of viral defense system n=1 Tax=Rhizobium lusitanum TaxID=293958 RepID=A0A7X0IXU2_9HYPH|nr:nucleotidyl transferase AbiEii/AbiGii toxin family protein [Rhizobium lusitanum]MBB6489176.1 putative nucleotidyltransferase component of viral defense system [Rhizobium lusitanum]
MAKELKNVGASVRARLLQFAKASGQSFDLVLTRFALERLLYRLGQSPHADRFVLKGAMLMMSWFDDPHRGTRDLDLLGFGESEAEPMLATFREIMSLEAADGVEFDIAALRIDRIREELEYGGLRLRTTASISGARIGLTIDIGFGDATEPGAEVLDYPSMLEFPAPRLRAYARETVIAEKFQAMVALGRANSRMKDFYDIWILSRSFAYNDDRLARAIAATFARRGTAIPVELPDGLTPAFAEDDQKQRQWKAFVEGVSHNPGTLTDVLADIAPFLMSHAKLAIDIDGGVRNG